jgi:hypothetical protein
MLFTVSTISYVKIEQDRLQTRFKVCPNVLRTQPKFRVSYTVWLLM